MSFASYLPRKFTTTLAAFALATGVAAPVNAAELKIGTRSEFVADPHAQWSATLMYYYVQYLGFLMSLDEKDGVRPNLAESAKAVSDTLWEVKLKSGLKFSDGRPLTMKDVTASYTRIRNLPKTTYSGLFAGIAEFKVIDDLTLHILTEHPYPTMPAMLTQFAILPEEIAKTASPADFMSAKANVSSTAYQFVEYVPGDRLVLVRNDNYHGPKAKWDKVTFRILPNGASRVAALLSGDVDVIDEVPASEVATIKSNKKFSVFAGPSDAVNYFQFDIGRDVTPFITDNAGNLLKVNPFKDIRVRRAFSLAIDRDLIRDRVMEGYSYPTNQIVPEGLGGFAEKLAPAKTDVEAARNLMAEAGYKDGFTMKMHCPEGRYPNGARICQTAAQMLARIGVKTTVEMMPRSIFFSRMTDRAGERGSFLLFGWGASSSGEASVLQQSFHTYDRDRRMGTWNLGHYSNPEVDAIIQKSLNAMDASVRHAIQAEAVVKTMEDVAVVPLHVQPVIVATKSELKFTIFANAYTLAEAVSPAQ